MLSASVIVSFKCPLRITVLINIIILFAIIIVIIIIICSYF